MPQPLVYTTFDPFIWTAEYLELCFFTLNAGLVPALYLVDDACDGVRGDEEEEESVEGEPGKEVSAAPPVQPAQREQVHHRRQRREHGHSQPCYQRTHYVTPV